MKRFEQLTNRDKGYNLHILFPGEISAFLTYVQGTAKAIVGKESLDQATTGMFPNVPMDKLKPIASEAADATESFFHLMADNAEFFAEQLFVNDLSGFVLDCLNQYSRICPNKKIKQYIALFFLD